MNHADMDMKGRRATGEKHGMAKLSEQQLKDIRANYVLCRVSHRELAIRFGVDRTRITQIVKGIRK